MNKLLIVLMAVCLISVHGFVKRDAPATEKTALDDIQNTVQDLAKKISEEASKVLNPEELKKNANSVLDQLSKAVEEAKNKLAAVGAKE